MPPLIDLANIIPALQRRITMEGAVASKKPDTLILIAGLATSFICLLIVYLVGLTGFEIMSFYVWRILPIGALAVGLGCGTGYAIGSRLSNVRISKGFLLLVALLAIGTYAAAQYLTYLQALKVNNLSQDQVSFVEYIKLTWGNMTYKNLDRGSEPFELGKLGYVLKSLEIAGFTLGVMLPVWILRQMSYCPTCQRYMTKTGSFFINSTALKSELKKKKKKEKEALIVDAVNSVTAQHDALVDRISSTGFDDTLLILSDLPRAQSSDSMAIVQYDLSKCPVCDNHEIAATLRNINVGNQYNTRLLGKIPKIGEHAAA